MQNRKIFCACGCGEQLLEWRTRISPVKKSEWFMYRRKFINGHETRGKFNPMFGKPGARSGHKNSLEHRKRISESNKGRKGKSGKENYFYGKRFIGSKNPVWKGGNSQWWRKVALKRDNFTCRVCGLFDEEIMQVDHIKPISRYPDLRFDLSNLRSICPNCHERKSIHEKGNRKIV